MSQHKLHRLGYRAAHFLRTIYWGLLRPEIHGCSVIAVNSEGKLVLVKPSYGRKLWHFPGGGMARDEDPVKAARREFHEETSLHLREVAYLGSYIRNLHGATNVMHVVAGKADGRIHIDHREIVAAGWFAEGEMPANRSETVEEILDKFAPPS